MRSRGCMYSTALACRMRLAPMPSIPVGMVPLSWLPESESHSSARAFASCMRSTESKDGNAGTLQREGGLHGIWVGSHVSGYCAREVV